MWNNTDTTIKLLLSKNIINIYIRNYGYETG